MLDIQHILHSFEKIKVLVVGDVMLDQYIYGSVNRISPEAPVPIIEVTKKSHMVGGAGNVAVNIQALGATPILCSVIGQDKAGTQLLKCLKDHGLTTDYLVRSTNRKTTAKKRVLSQGQQMLRMDEEDRHSLDRVEEEDFFKTIKKIVEAHSINIMILQDYNKGVLYPTTIQKLLLLAKQQDILVAVDPKINHFFEYKNVTLFKPNLREMRQQYPYITPTLKSLDKATAQLTATLGNQETLITLSEKGVYYAHGGASMLTPTIERSVADVSGAGDSVISIASLGIATNLNRKTIAILSNLTGGQVCEKVGVVPVDKELLRQDYKQYLDLLSLETIT